MPDAEIITEQLAIARRAAWVGVDLYGLEKAIQDVDNTLAHYTKRQADGHTTDPLWPLEKLRVALVEIEAQRGTATGLLVQGDRDTAHGAIDQAEAYARDNGLLTPAEKHMYRAQRYWVDRISDDA